MPKVKLRATSLPSGDGDGLTYHAPAFVNEPSELRLILALVDTRQIVRDVLDGEQTAIVRIRRIEVVADVEDRREVQRIMLRANERRKGGTVLPLDMEAEIESAFATFAAEEPDAEPETDEAPTQTATKPEPQWPEDEPETDEDEPE
jgi:hypothetical protein